MSWSVYGTVKLGHVDSPTLREQALAQNPECGDQFDKVMEAALDIMYSGIVGGQAKEFYITLSGHSNPNHEPREGWANEITIQISQK